MPVNKSILLLNHVKFYTFFSCLIPHFGLINALSPSNSSCMLLLLLFTFLFNYNYFKNININSPYGLELEFPGSLIWSNWAEATDVVWSNVFASSSRPWLRWAGEGGKVCSHCFSNPTKFAFSCPRPPPTLVCFRRITPVHRVLPR